MSLSLQKPIPESDKICQPSLFFKARFKAFVSTSGHENFPNFESIAHPT